MVSSFRVDHKIVLQAECFRNVNHMYDGIDQMVEIQKYYICDRIHCKEKMLIPYTKMRQIKFCKLISIVEISPECLYLDNCRKGTRQLPRKACDRSIAIEVVSVIFEQLVLSAGFE